MADGPASEWKPEAQGEGVGGQSEQRLKDEGMEHIKQNTETPSQKVASGITEPPATNPGADDAAAGMNKGSGGVSGSANIGSPVPDAGEEKKTIMGTMKDYVMGVAGMGNKEASDADATAATATGVAGGSESDKATRNAAGAEGQQDSSVSGRAKDAAGDVAAGAAATGAVAAGAVGAEETKKNLEQTAEDTKASPDTNTTASAAKDQSEDSNMAAAGEEKTETSGDNAHKPPQPGGRDAKAENRTAIPTAGGERLGDKHWGESKIVPDNPKPAKAEETGPGVSSEEGQPTEQVKDNTAKNTGTATSGPSHSTQSEKAPKEKEKLVDKLKERLHIGQKDKDKGKS